jgi:hypothetical protein
VADPAFASASPSFALDNEPSRDLADACLKVEIHDELTRTMQAHFAEGPVIELGQAIGVTLGAAADQRTIFGGVISAVELVFEDGAQPAVVVSAEDATPPMVPRATSYTLVRGQELVSARVVVKKAQAFVLATGLTSGWPDFGIGSDLRLEHIGASFSGDGYRVTRVGHTFDLEHGLRSTFTAERPI